MNCKIRSMLLLVGVVVLTNLLGHQVSAQNRLIPVADTGVVTLGSNQIVRVSVALGDVTGDGADAIVRFRQMKYEPCQPSPKLCITQQSLSNAILLTANEASVVDGADLAVWRTIVTSNRRDLKVTAIVFDTSTQRVVTQIIVANTEGDIH